MVAIKNPYEGLPEHGCFCCSSKNPIGLKLSFWYDETNQTVETRWLPELNYQGYHGVLQQAGAYTYLKVQRELPTAWRSFTVSRC